MISGSNICQWISGTTAEWAAEATMIIPMGCFAFDTDTKIWRMGIDAPLSSCPVCFAPMSTLAVQLNAQTDQVGMQGVIGNNGSGGSANTGSVEIDFGPFPGTTETFITITGQASIAPTSKIFANIAGVATADHGVDEHVIESIRINVGAIVAGQGFTIFASSIAPPILVVGRNNTNYIVPRLTGRYTVHWQWA